MGSVLLQVMGKKGKQILHHNLLKFFVGEFVPAWIQRQIQTCSSDLETIEEETEESSMRISLAEITYVQSYNVISAIPAML